MMERGRGNGKEKSGEGRGMGKGRGKEKRRKGTARFRIPSQGLTIQRPGLEMELQREEERAEK